MGIRKYKANGQHFWRVLIWLDMPDGSKKRWRQGRIPTKDMALALERKVKADAFEGRFFDRVKKDKLTVKQAWEIYKPVAERNLRDFKTEAGRAKHLCRHLGKTKITSLSMTSLERYRYQRERETTQRGAPPTPATVNREIGLLRRTLNFLVENGTIETNPLTKVQLVKEDNVRESVIASEVFEKLLAAAADYLQPILVVAYDTGLRKQEILKLRWDQVHLNDGLIRLSAADTKSHYPRIIPMTSRVKETLHALPRALSGYVFANPKTGKPYHDVKRSFAKACSDAKIDGIWFHDLRRSFVTNARRHGVPESVVMRLSGHKSRSVFDRYNIIDEFDLRHAIGKIEAATSDTTGTASL